MGEQIGVQLLLLFLFGFFILWLVGDNDEDDER